jgi:membrane-bound metal-dependent hydrolase YbcI (DUF457 family)
MANFNTHLTIATTASIGMAFVVAKTDLIATTDLPWLIFLGCLGGILPDIDASNSKPVKLLFNILALMGVASVLQVYKDTYEPHQLLLLVAGTYLFIRYVVFGLFNRLTIHRGVFHSLLAALCFAFLMTNISYHFLHWDDLHAWLNGIFIGIGFVIHLLLDELYSVDLSNVRTKNSFGTALKLFNPNNVTASGLMAIVTLMLYLITPSSVPLVSAWKATHWSNYLSQLTFLE